MQKRDRKQRKNIIFSTSVVALGCLISAVYANKTVSDAPQYKVDLSKLDEEQGNAQEETSVVTGDELVNQFPTKPDTKDDAKEKEKQETQNTGVETKKADVKSQTGEQGDGEKLLQNSITDESSDAKTSIDNPISVLMAENEVGKLDVNFQPEDKMLWPTEGSVILGYSMDQDIYFETLEQYRYNPAIYIGTKEGSKVCACANGTVKELGEDAKLGHYLVLDLGNGYQLKYAQLQNLQVKKDDVVAKGQILGDVAKTTRFFTLEGDHLYLELTKDNNPIDPTPLFQ